MYSSQASQHNAGQSYENVLFNTYYPQPSTYDASYSWNMHYNAYPSHVMHDDVVNNAALMDRPRARQEDEKAIEQFLRQSEQVPTKSKRKDPFKIATVKGALMSVAKLNKKLEIICTELDLNVDLPEEQWQERVSACNAAKHEICEILKTVKDADFLSRVKNDLEKRKKKRKRERLGKEKWKREKLMKEERKARSHAEADSSIRKEQAVLEREKQEEKLRKDADMILSDVRSKRNDARKYLGILQDLQNFRRIKMNVVRARGENWSSAADDVFNNSTAKLMEYWTTLDREYAVEEQELKHMLKMDNEKRIEKQKKNLCDDWENVLFGTSILTTEQSSREDVNNFIMIRMAWDKFVSSKNDATTIPIGWIVPEKPSSAAWQKCLNKETS
ncbi:hypothetical protein DMN91_008030 [Ooceraea biroi]|uniref:Programmed cell death protein n=1 Tax=Ooceraea biroi TaxID=2015173 RepID=A0A026WYE3_OOCBI|nr:uncharacterized protein LOC105287833 [Ooceraea biroi]EZA60863.1 Programmed cell death protein [Ooceraea biroi]RLU19473.1 hypothetical protein DMN91_008030 [Ooceraea biroi]